MLTQRMNELAARHPRYGYRRIWALLRSEGFEGNHKRIERLWRLAGHKVPPRRRSSGQKAVGGSAFGTWATQAGAPNDVWSYDFVAARTEDGQALRILNVVDEYTRRCLGCRVARNIGARDLIVVLGELFAKHGKAESDPV
jgi:putative transposase